MTIYGYNYLHKRRRQSFGPLYEIDFKRQVRHWGKWLLILAVIVAALVLPLITARHTKHTKLEPVTEQKIYVPDPCGLQDVYCPSESIPRVGLASFLDYKLSDTCATRDWVKGTRLQVSANGKSITCTVRDFGPVKEIYPDRIIDLNRAQFAELSDTSVGIIDVMVRPI